MRILTYKRTHIGDPDSSGRFGINDCMGRIRSLQYDAVIGVGGKGAEPRMFGIDGKITWIGLGPKRRDGGPHRRAEVVTFEHFILFDERGPQLHDLAPALAKKMYSGRRFVLNSYSDEEKAEALAIVQWAKDQPVKVGLRSSPALRRVCRKSRCVTPKKKRCRITPKIFTKPYET